jgi:hypothetical protein
MSDSEAFRDQVNSALEAAVAGDRDLDDIETVLQDGLDRVQEIRAIRGEN